MKSRKEVYRLIRGWLPRYPRQTRSLSNLHILGGAVVALVIAVIFTFQTLIPIPQTSVTSEQGPITILDSRLPTARSITSAVYDGRRAYVIGGDQGGKRTAQIVIFDPAEETVYKERVSLPYPMATTAVWTGRFIYMFGGSLDYIPDLNLIDNPKALDVIIRYDPAEPSIKIMEAKLPSPRMSTTAVWDGTYAYIFGGAWGQQPKTWGGECFDDILRYDPSTDVIEIMSAKLPSPRRGAAAVYDGEYIYIFGGTTSTYYSDGELPDEIIYLGEVLRYDPEMDEIEVVSVVFPQLSHMSCVWNGSSVYIFGGGKKFSGHSAEEVVSREVLEYIPGEPWVKWIAELPEVLDASSAIWDGQSAYIFGGVKGPYVTSDILKLKPEKKSDR